jgi:hypothetical protein
MRTLRDRLGSLWLMGLMLAGFFLKVPTKKVTKVLLP